MKTFDIAWRLEGYIEGGSENQDRVGICDEAQGLVFVVADGEGSNPEGMVASRRVIDIVRKAIAGERPNDDPKVWQERLAGIDRMLSRDRQAGQSGAVIVSVAPHYGTARVRRLVGASVGTVGGWLIREAGVETFPIQEADAPLLGTGKAAPITFDIEWSEGTLLLATDGLLKHAPEDKIAAIALQSDIEQAADELLALPRSPDARQQDDIGLLLCRNISHSKSSVKSSEGNGVMQALRNFWNRGKR